MDGPAQMALDAGGHRRSTACVRLSWLAAEGDERRPCAYRTNARVRGRVSEREQHRERRLGRRLPLRQRHVWQPVDSKRPVPRSAVGRRVRSQARWLTRDSGDGGANASSQSGRAAPTHHDVMDMCASEALQRYGVCARRRLSYVSVPVANRRASSCNGVW